jgi:hypothetical protein
MHKPFVVEESMASSESDVDRAVVSVRLNHLG